MRKTRRVAAYLALIAFAPALAVTLLLTPSASAALKNRNANAPAAVEGFRPTLAINIPTITFSGIVLDSNTNGDQAITGYLDIPWLGEYVRGIYSYAVVAAVVLAGVMFVVGGFYYLTAGGDASRVQKGRKRIADAIIGLLLVYGAYTVLMTLSPQLTTFESLRIKRLKQNPLQMIDESVTTTHEATGTDPSIDSSGTVGTPPQPTPPPPGTPEAGPPPAPLPPPSGNNYVQLYSSCPIADLPAKHITTCPFGGASTQCGDESPSGERGTTFRDRMRALIASETDVRRKIAMVSEAGVKCFTHYGSCGSTATTWQAIAGVGADTLGANQPNSGGTTRWGGVSHEIPVSVSWQTFAIACNAVCTGNRFRDVCGARCDPATRPNGSVIENSYKVVRDCYRGADARAQARTLIANAVPGWPDSWTQGLEIGDFIIIFNGNPSCASSHAQIFMGWTGGGRAKVANGQWAGPQWEDVRCYMRSCGPNFEVVTKIFKPRSLAH